MPKNKNKKKKIVDSNKSICKNDLSYPFAFKKLPYYIQQSSHMNYRWVEYDYASHMAQKWGIKSARQYRSFVQFFQPSGIPSNPDKVYNKQWEGWNAFLNGDNCYAGYDPESVTAAELLPYIDAVTWTQSQQFETVEKYQEAYDDGMMPTGIPRAPQVRYKDFYPRGWKYYLGKKIEHRLDAKKDLEPVCTLCQTVGQSPNVLQLVINSQGIVALRAQMEKAKHLTPIKAYYWYHDYGTYVFELMDTMGTKQNENTWMFPDVNALFYELGSVLGEYRA